MSLLSLPRTFLYKGFISRFQFSAIKAILLNYLGSPWFVRNADLRFALRLKTIKATIRKIAEKFFNNLESIDNRTLRKIEIYTPDPNFNRPRNILIVGVAFGVLSPVGL
ncbi:hypothetical protein TNCV_4337921 [Trichonephila clavipes]|uniref:Uncharacterized protein n=1 Tax=Trichonephila clavipes TaxID=2585209 RepID=A0A8X6SYR8_TRICX|nr:hypothetical protein TNCV_4337921 [Trichonephila clavipes]